MVRRPAPAATRTAVADPVWDRFVDRCGVTITLALLVVIVSLTNAVTSSDQLVEALAGPQLLLMLIVLGCVGVLAFRQNDI